MAVRGGTGDRDTLAGSGCGVGRARGASLAAKIRQLPQMTARRSVSYKGKQDGRPLVQDEPPAGPPGEVREPANPRSNPAVICVDL